MTRLERLKELWCDAFGVVRSEWDFGEFREKLNLDEKEAEEIFIELSMKEKWISEAQNYLCHKPYCPEIKSQKVGDCNCGVDKLAEQAFNWGFWQ